MIQLTRLNNKPLVLNSDLIKFVERSPDTLITLINGEKLVVLETPEQVLTRVTEFRRSVIQGLSEVWNAPPKLLPPRTSEPDPSGSER